VTLGRDNNFDLIRLLAAGQVLAMHAIAWLEVPAHPLLLEIADWFPGVPIFFMISGCLVTASFSRSPSVREFLRNRALRIFPGLWLCLLISYALVMFRGGLADSGLPARTLAWFAANATVFQFAGAFGTGVANGALWSISTEIQFYLLIPIAAWVFARRVPPKWVISATIALLAVSLAVVHQEILAIDPAGHPWAYPALYASLFANGHLFLLGVLAYLWRGWLIPVVRGRLLWFLLLYLAIRSLLTVAGMPASAVHATTMAIVVYPFLALVVFAAAFSIDGLARRVLNGNDLSYGIYIYHMPVIYALMHVGLTGYSGFSVAWIIVGALAAMSWFLVESPMLRLKHYSTGALPATENSALGTTVQGEQN
jgi:peptidoglycan/LPS O-acetylase OafA/YrhL